jgi:hypothetical protein
VINYDAPMLALAVGAPSVPPLTYYPRRDGGDYGRGNVSLSRLPQWLRLPAKSQMLSRSAMNRSLAPL